MSLWKLHASRRPSRSGLETLRTEQLQALHERHFGALHAETKRRMLETARSHGWDRSWDGAWVDGLAA